MTSEETEDAGAGLKPGRRANWLALRRRGGRTLNSEEKTWKV